MNAAYSESPLRDTPLSNTFLKRTLSLFLFLLIGVSWSRAELGDAIYTLDPQGFYEYNDGKFGYFDLEVVPEGLKLTAPPGTPNNWNLYMLRDQSKFQGGEQYTMVMTFKTVTPTNYPYKFFVFARPRGSGKSQYDILKEWEGEAGEPSRTIVMPLDLSSYDQDFWQIHMGVYGPGALIIESLVFYEGNNFEIEPATSDVSSVNDSVSGVTPATGASGFTVAPPAPPESVITVAGLIPDSPSDANANREILKGYLGEIKTNQVPVTLKIPTGKYYFEVHYPFEIKIIDTNDLTLDGQGSTFIFQNDYGADSAFLFLRSNRLAIKNLYIDWDWSNKPLASLGTVSNISADNKECDFTFPYLDASETAATAASSWLGIFPMDEITLAKDAVGYFKPESTTVSHQPGTNVVHATFSDPLSLEEGESYCIRHIYYEMVCFKLKSCTNTVFDNVHIRSFPSMGWLVVGESHDLVIRGCSIARAEGSHTPLTTTADGVHVSESQGNILIEDTIFQGMGDDSINIHDNCYQGYAAMNPTDSKMATLKYCQPHQLRLEVGDILELYNPNYSTIGAGPSTIERVVAGWASSGNDMIITFQTDLPASFSPYTIFRNQKFGVNNVTIRNCQFLQSHGHGILYSGEDITIESCLFQDVYSTPIQLEVNIFATLAADGTYTYWYEGRPTDNVLIKNNNFFNSNRYNTDPDAAAIWAVPTLPWGTIDNYLFTQVTIEDNTFSGLSGAIAYIENASNLLIRGNEYLFDGDLPVMTNAFGAIFVSKSKDASLGGNDWYEYTPSAHNFGVIYDSSNTFNMSTGINALHDGSGFTTEDFESYAANSSFTTGQSLGVVGDGWAFAWRTAGSYTFPTGTIDAVSAIDGTQSLAVEIESWSGKTSATGAVTRAFDATLVDEDGYLLQFSIRPDSLPSNMQIRLTETKNRAPGPDATSAWEIVSLNGTWQAYDASSSAYIDTQISITVGQVYNITIMLNPTSGIWSLNIANDVISVQLDNLVSAFSSYDVGTGEAIGGRWLNFGAKEIVTNGSTVGSTAGFIIDSIFMQALSPLAKESFEGYLNGSSFSTNESFGIVEGGWASSWKTGGSYAIPEGVVSDTNPLSDSQSLAVEVETFPGGSYASGAVTRAYDASQLANSVYSTHFTYRVDATPADVRYTMSDVQTHSPGSDSTSAWLVSSVNGTWQAFDGGSTNVYVDTGIAVTAGQEYSVTVNLNAASGTWDLIISDGVSTEKIYNLLSRYASYNTDSSGAVGGRWINFAVKEIVSGSSVGATGYFTIDSLRVQAP